MHQRNSGSIPTRNVVGDDVVGYVHRVPLRGSRGEADHLRAIDVLQAEAAAAAAFRSVAHNQVGVDRQTGTGAVARPNRAQRRYTIRVGRGAAGRIDVGRAHDDDTAAVSRDSRVRALIEEDAVVRDLAVLAEAHVNQTATVTRAQVSAQPVVVELVVIRAGAEADTARPRRRGGE